VLYRRRAFRKKVCTSAVLWRAFDKAVRRKPPVVAADAGPMQIQLWEGAVPRFAGTVRESTAANTEGEKGEVDSEFLGSGRSRKWKEAICRRARHTETECADTRKDFLWSRVVSCGLDDQGGRRTKLDLGSSESFDDHHRPTAFWTAPKITGVFAG
jgi:hypothetical protein